MNLQKKTFLETVLKGYVSTPDIFLSTVNRRKTHSASLVVFLISLTLLCTWNHS